MSRSAWLLYRNIGVASAVLRKRIVIAIHGIVFHMNIHGDLLAFDDPVNAF
jgi:hypothetical protein